MKKYSLEITVFLCGAALMILELVGSRVLAPYIGTSTIVWTSLIGIILGALSLGYYVGGKMADKEADRRKLAIIILGAAFFVLAIVLVNEEVLIFVREVTRNIYVTAVAATIFLFAVPSFLLGIVSPYAVKLKVKDLQYTGRMVGDLYAISTIGSIVGTFAAGFLLIPFLGTINILYFLVALLIFASLMIVPGKLLGARWALIIILFGLIIFFLAKSAHADASRLIDVDSQYNRIWIVPASDAETKRPVLRLSTDPYGIQSGMFLDGDNDLVYRYSKYYRLADAINPAIRTGLMIGGAAYSYPKDFLKNHPGASMDVVEIDPAMTELAKKYFNLKDDPRLRIYHEDARVFLNNNQKKYDAVYVDAFTSHLSIPYQLTTREAAQEIYNGMNDNGVVIVNIISALQGGKSKFLRAELATYQAVFPQVYLFRVYNTDAYKVQNVMLMAVKSPVPAKLQSDNAELYSYFEMLYQQPNKNDLPVLTDDYAPVDYYTMNMIK
ncbi:MAG: fused MFS/spermidine synthase [Patescibacteria group bacterium]|nr:fused MFS/spermidine synthase [Patescibacteria group bacterium]